MTWVHVKVINNKKKKIRRRRKWIRFKLRSFHTIKYAYIHTNIHNWTFQWCDLHIQIDFERYFEKLFIFILFTLRIFVWRLVRGRFFFFFYKSLFSYLGFETPTRPRGFPGLSYNLIFIILTTNTNQIFTDFYSI